MASGAAEDEASEAEATGAEAESTETHAHTEYILLIELHHIRIFSAPRRTICHLLIIFFLTGLHVFLTFQLAHPVFFVLFLEGVGVR